MTADDEYVTIHCIYKMQTDKAILIIIGKQEVWIPKSCIHSDCFPLSDKTTILEIKQWLAKQKSLI